MHARNKSKQLQEQIVLGERLLIKFWDKFFSVLVAIYVVLVCLYYFLSETFAFSFFTSYLNLGFFEFSFTCIGALLFFLDLFYTRKSLQNLRYMVPLFLVLIALIASSLALGQFDTFNKLSTPSTSSNTCTILRQASLFLVVFPLCASLNKKQIGLLTRIIYWICAVLFIPSLVVSFYEFLNSIGYEVIFGTDAGSRQGYIDGRLFGVFMGVFSSGCLMSIYAFISAYFAYSTKHKTLRVIYIIFACTSFLYAILTSTRSLLVAFATSCVVISFLLLIQKLRFRGAARIFSSLGLALVIGICAGGAFLGIESLSSLIPAHNNEVNNAQTNTSEGNEGVDGVQEDEGESSQDGAVENNSNISTATSQTKEDHLVVLAHAKGETTSKKVPIVASYLYDALWIKWVNGSVAPYDEESLVSLSLKQDTILSTVSEQEKLSSSDSSAEDSLDNLGSTTVSTNRSDTTEGAEISNGRIDIWKDYLSIVFSSPKNALLGLSPGCYMSEICRLYPNGGIFIIDHIKENYPNMFASGLIYDVHNAYISMLVQGGLISFCLIMLFVVRIIKAFVRGIRAQNIDKAPFVLLGFVLVFILVAAAFNTTLFFKMTSASVVFWVASGFVVALSKDSKKHASRESENEPKQIDAL